MKKLSAIAIIGLTIIGQTAFAMSSMNTNANLTITPPTTTTSTIGERTVMAHALNVRSAPSMKGKRIGHLVKGDKVTVESKNNNNWCQITYKAKTAYVACRYLK